MRPRPPPLEGDDTKAPSLRQELSKRPMVDNDLDISVDLGEAVARTPQPRSRPSSPMLLDYPSPIPNAKFAPVVRPQPGECKKLGSCPIYLIVLVPLSWSFPLLSMCASPRRHRIADLSSCAVIAPGCDSEEPPLVPSNPHNITVEREKAKR